MMMALRLVVLLGWVHRWVASEQKITACLYQPSLPSAMFRDASAFGYGTGRVKWHVLQTMPQPDGSPFGDDEVVCDAVFWQDEDWHPTFSYYRKSDKASPRFTSRVVAGWTSESCIRTDDIIDIYEFAWYPGPLDDATHLCPLPLGPSAAFPYVNTLDDDDDNDDDDDEKNTFDYLVNYLASLETSQLRLTWFTEAKELSERLLAGTRYCAFIRAHKKWQEPVTYAAERDDSSEDAREEPLEDRRMTAFTTNCTCQTMKACNNATGFVGALTSGEFASIISRSAFTLSPPGHNFQTFRHWEAAAVSSIPIMMDPETGKDECTKSERHFFGHRNSPPFLFAATPLEALETMMNLVADPPELSKRRREVRKWYDDEMFKAVRRVEAAVTAAASVADAVYGPATSLRRKPVPAPLGTVVGRKPKHQKRNVMALTLDGPLAKQLLVWLNDVHGIAAAHNFVEVLRDDGAITVGWVQAGAGDNSTFSETLLGVLPKPPLSTIHLAPVVLFARDPLEYIPDLAARLKVKPPHHNDDAQLQAFIEGRFNASTPAVHLAARYWVEWTRRAFAMSSFDLQIEAFDPIVAFKALGLRHHRNIMDADQKPFTLQNRGSRWTWTKLAAEIGRVSGGALLDDLRSLAAALGYD